MSGMTPRELIIENLRLQDQMTEAQEREHEVLVQSMRIMNNGDGNGGGGSLGERSRNNRSVNVLASTNADLSRRVQSAVVGEANAMSRMQKMEENAKDQDIRFSELVEISRNEEHLREKAELHAEECQLKLKTSEDRVVRLLSRFHTETSNNERLKKMLQERDASKDEYAGDVAMRTAYEQISAECNELRHQVGELRSKNATLMESMNDMCGEDRN
jgi:hypothetical protein